MIRILNLVLYSDDQHYNQMYRHLNRFYAHFRLQSRFEVKTVFYKNDSITEDYLDEATNILHLKGEESWDTYTTCILSKTLRAFRYFEDDLKNYDYVVRSNISTIVDFKLLAEELEKNPILYYGGGRKNNLQWFGGGIQDKKWFGTDFIQGTCIIFTADAVKFIIHNEHLVRPGIVDDLSFGIFMREHKPEVIAQGIDHRYVEVPPFYRQNNIDVQKIYDMTRYEFIFYRNKCYGICSNDREVDVAQMKLIIDVLLNKYK